MPKNESANPFVRYRWLLDSYRRAVAAGWSDAQFVELVERLDRSVQAVDQVGFTVTPLTHEPRLAAGLGLTNRLWVKDETVNVASSHKGRHLFGTMLDLSVGGHTQGELVIASCGNAALAAAVVAKAAERPIRVFIPTWADPVIVAMLETLGANIEIRPREVGIPGDPTVVALHEAIAAGGVPFSVQGPITSSAVDGGRTLGWEAGEQLALARVQGTLGVFVQVGGGALAAAVWQGLGDAIREQWLSVTPTLHTVQTEASAPLNRAWSLVKQRGLDEAAGAPGEFMWPWEEVGTSAANGILDDVTYDWWPVMEAMIDSGGQAHVVTEHLIEAANALARETTDIDVDPTGSAGVAALLDPTVAEIASSYDHVLVFFTGHRRERI